MEEPESFETTLDGARDGSAPAFATLFRAFNPSLIRYLHVAVSAVADDLASETWLEVARDVKRFRGNESDFRRWFFTIARHRALDHARKQRRGRAEPVPTEALSEIPDRADLTEESMSTSDALKLIATLPKSQAEAVALRVVADLSVADVAKVMGKRPGAIRALTSRGLRALAEQLSSASSESTAPEPPGSTEI
jgi:RNA polymerase sigma-70 factor (ECF subfamily)